MLQEVIKRLTACQLHGNLTLTWFSRDRPIAGDGFTTETSLITLELWLDWSIIVPIACRRHIGSRPMLIADCYSLLAGNESQRPKNM